MYVYVCVSAYTFMCLFAVTFKNSQYFGSQSLLITITMYEHTYVLTYICMYVNIVSNHVRLISMLMLYLVLVWSFTMECIDLYIHTQVKLYASEMYESDDGGQWGNLRFGIYFVTKQFIQKVCYTHIGVHTILKIEPVFIFKICPICFYRLNYKYELEFNLFLLVFLILMYVRMPF